MKYFILDIDGTILDGNTAINNSVEFIKKLQSGNIDFILTTNSIKSPEEQLNRLNYTGIKVTKEQIYSPINSINNYLSNNSISNVLVVGSPLEKKQILCTHNDKNPELIILLDFEKENYDYRRIQSLINYVDNGCPVITAFKSFYYLSCGKKRLETGAFAGIIESVTGSNIEVFGKPSKHFFNGAKNNFAGDSNNYYIIGDDWSTDIKGGISAGCRGILIRSGKYTEGDETKIKTFRVINDLLDIEL